MNAMLNKLIHLMLVVPFLLKAQIPAGSDAQHPTTILMNTDSVYAQNRSSGWFVFNTHNVNNVSGNVINLKTAIVQTPVSSTIVKIKIVNLYDSTLNLLASDTLHSGDTSLVFTASVTTDKWYYLQTIANYPCDTCVYNEAVSYNISLLGINLPPINLCGFCANNLSGILTSSPPPNQSYCINNDIYIYTSINFTSSEFKIKPGVRIVVGNGGVLTINNSHLYSCVGMWKGIVVYDPATNAASSGRVFIQNNSLIEDANAAVSYPYGNTNIAAVFFSSDQTIFNRNDTGIVLRNYFPSGTGVPMTYYFSVQRTIITSRRIPYNTTPPFIPTSAYYSNVKATASNPGVPYASPYIKNSSYPFIQTKAGNNAQIGIYLFRVGLINLPLTFYEVQIGATVGFQDIPFINIFDNLSNGIYAVSSNFTCVNNVFQNGNTNSSGQVGRGIYAIANRIDNNRIRVIPKTLPTYTTQYWGIGNNKFFDVSRAIETVNYLFHHLVNNDIRSSQVNTLPTLPPPFHKGEYGILITTNRFHKNVIEYNTIFNIENGIIHHCTFGMINIPTITPGTVFNAQYSGQIKIDSNFIQPNLPYTPVTTQYVSNGIYVANTLPYGNYYPNPSLSVSTSSNSIKNVYRGIYVGSFHNKVVTTNRNCITLSNEPSATPNPIQYGILREFMQGAVSLSNQIISNNISGAGISNPNMSGIYIRGSSFENVRCNNVGDVYNAVVFDKCPQTCRFIGNSMVNFMRGYSLMNSSIIGPQGAMGSPSDNQWNLLPSGAFKTAVINANPVLSPLYVRMNPPNLNPQGSCFSGSGFGPCYDILTTPGSLIFTTGPIYLPCPNNMILHTCAPWILPPLIAVPPSTVPPIITPTNNLIPLMEQIVQNQIPLTPMDAWTKKNAVFRSIQYEPFLQTSSNILNNFYINNTNSSYQQMLDIETDIFNGMASSAQSKINALSPQNIMESNFKTYYQIYMNYANGTYSSTDSVALYQLASSCSLLNGDVVYLARALYNAVNNKIIIWDDNCNANNSSGQRLLQATANSSSQKNEDNIQIYPNPSKGEFYITSSSGKTIQHIRILDVTGKEVYSKPIPIGTTYPYSLRLDIAPGIYMADITTESGEHFIQKIMLEK